MPNYGTLLAATKKEIREITTHQAAELLADDYVALDVRDPEEYDQGALVGSLHISRGQLESQIEQRIPETDTNIVVYCAGGARSAFATKTLNELGYSEVVSMMGGFNQWKSDGREWQMPASMTGRQRARYQRHLLLPEIGEEGQQRLLDARVLILGAGGLGSPAALYLAAAGVGTIGIIDMDVVDETNLQRQIIHNTHRVGQSKVESAKQSILALNPDVKVEAIDRQLNVDNALELVADWDVIVDGADNFPSRYLLNDTSVKLGIPVVHGSIFRFEGQVTVFDPLSGPTYRDYVPSPPPPELAPSCAEAGVLGVLPAVIGSLQATEAIKLLLKLGEPLIGRLLAFDALDMTFREYKLKQDPQNQITYENRDRIQLLEYDQYCSPALNETGQRIPGT